MPKSAMIRARIEPQLKQEVEDIFARLGLNVTEALSLFYHQVKLNRGLPFEVSLPAKSQPSTLADQSLQTLIKKAKSMKPQERLEAFFEHSFLLNQMRHAGLKKNRGD